MNVGRGVSRACFSLAGFFFFPRLGDGLGSGERLRRHGDLEAYHVQVDDARRADVRRRELRDVDYLHCHA